MEVAFVDDDADLRAAVVQSLELAGLKVVACASGQEALSRLPKDYPGVVVTDIRMPGMDGLALMQALHARDPEQPVVLITGHGDIDMAVQAMHDGAFDFLTKPVALAVLRQSLQRAAWFALRQQELLAQGRLHLSVSAQLSEGVREASDQVAEQLIRHVLSCNGFNVTAAARTLGLEREQLYYHMKKFGIQRSAGIDTQPDASA